MKNSAENRVSELSGSCEVCGDSSYPQYLISDIFITVKIDDPEQRKTFDRRIMHRYCQSHSRAGKLIIERESQEAYFARLRAAENVEI